MQMYPAMQICKITFDLDIPGVLKNTVESRTSVDTRVYKKNKDLRVQRDIRKGGVVWTLECTSAHPDLEILMIFQKPVSVECCDTSVRTSMEDMEPVNARDRV